MGTVISRATLAFFAGILAWAVMEPSATGKSGSPDWEAWEVRFMMVFGAIVGAAIGGLEGYSRGGLRNVLRSVLFGAFLGAVGATLGHRIGGALFEAFGAESASQVAAIPLLMIARTAAFIPMGTLLGLAIGASQLSWPRTLQGAVGGFIGGALGGIFFDPIGVVFGSLLLTLRGEMSGEVGIVARAVAFPMMAALIGAMIGLVSRVARRAWLRLDLGRNEGREWAIERPRTAVGRDERADIPLFGDPAVGALHFTIDRVGGRYVLQDAGSPAGTFVEDVRVVGPVDLQFGHRIRVGNTVLTFRGKGASNVARAPVPIMQPTAAGPMGGGFVPRTLVGVSGAVAGGRFPIGSALEIGRDGSGIRLNGDTRASRRHAVVRDGPLGAAVEDLGSTNGTWVNGHRVPSAALSPGDELRIGDATFRVE